MAYSLDFREKVLGIKEDLGLTFEETAERFGVGKATLTRWSKDIYPKTTRNKPCTKIDMQKLKKDIEEHPDAYIKERASRLGVSYSGTRAAMQRINVTYKKNPLSSKSGSRKKIYILQKN